MVTEDSPGTETDDPYCLPGEAAGTLLRGHAWHRVVVLGDSVAEGLGEATPGYRDAPWTDRIVEALRETRPGVEYTNLGTRNRTAKQVRAEQLDPAARFRPDLGIVACGGYDLIRGAYDPDEVGEHVRAIVATLRDQGADVLTVGMFDISLSPYVPDKWRDALRRDIHTLADRTEALSSELGGIHVDLTRHPTSSSPDMYSRDGRHGSARSHAVAAAESVRRLAEHITGHSPLEPAQPH